MIVKYLFILIFFVPILLFAQADTSNSQTTVIILSQNHVPFTKNSHLNEHAFKLGLFQLISGLYGVSYEREASLIFSMQVSAGLTGRNWLSGLLHSETDMNTDPSPNFGLADDVEDNDYSFDGRESKIGYYFDFMPKFYYDDEDGLDGTYFGLNVQYRRCNFLAYGTQSLEGRYVSGAYDVNEYEKQLIVGLVWGHQTLNHRSAVDYFCMIGVRNVNGGRRDLGLFVDQSGSQFIAAGPLLREVKSSNIMFEMGLRIGVWWKKGK